MSYDTVTVRILILFKCRWQCQYGPQDNRDKVVEITPEMAPKPKKYNWKGKQITSGLGQKGHRSTAAKEGGSMTVGCQCRFYVKRYYYLPAITKIGYFCKDHVDNLGIIVHDKDTPERGKLRFRNRISDEVRDWVLRQYDELVPMEAIKQKHQRLVLKGRDNNTLTCSRDCFLSMEDIRNICGIRSQELYKKHDNDAESVRMWVRESPQMMFYYQDPGTKVEGVLNSENAPFVIGIQTPFQMQIVVV